MQLQKFIDKMTHWLTETEETLLRCSRNLDPESLNLVKVSAEESEYTSILMRWTSFFVGIFTSWVQQLSFIFHFHLIKKVHILQVTRCFVTNHVQIFSIMSLG